MCKYATLATQKPETKPLLRQSKYSDWCARAVRECELRYVCKSMFPTWASPEYY